MSTAPRTRQRPRLGVRGWPASARVGAAALAVVTLVQLATQLANSGAMLNNLSQDLLMPLLALVLLLATDSPRPRLTRVTLVALGFSFLGDAGPDLVGGDATFLVMVGCFLLAQLAYIVAFWPSRHRSIVRRPAWLLPYAAVFVALVLACVAGSGGLIGAVMVYGLALVTMAVLSTGVSRVAGAGGVIFLVSDALIALGQFTSIDLPAHGFLVMLTYVVGQSLIAWAVVGAGRTPPS